MSYRAMTGFLDLGASAASLLFAGSVRAWKPQPPFGLTTTKSITNDPISPSLGHPIPGVCRIISGSMEGVPFPGFVACLTIRGGFSLEGVQGFRGECAGHSNSVVHVQYSVPTLVSLWLWYGQAHSKRGTTYGVVATDHRAEAQWF